MNTPKAVGFDSVLLSGIESGTPEISADVFRGEVIGADASQGTVTVRYRDENGRIVAEKTFRMTCLENSISAGLNDALREDAEDEVELFDPRFPFEKAG